MFIPLNIVVMDAKQIIEKLGGTAKTSRLCEVSMAAVSQWKENGIPRAQLKFIKLARPEIFKTKARKAA